MADTKVDISSEVSAKVMQLLIYTLNSTDAVFLIFWINKTEIWIMVWKAIRRLVHRCLNASCKFCRCFDRSLPLWRLLVMFMGKCEVFWSYGLLRRPLQLKRFCSDSARVLCLYRRFFGSALKSMWQRWTQMIVRFLACAYVVCCTSWVITS